MAKRTATSELNHDNWDAEDGVEEAGTFSRASDDALKKRIIKVARRRNPVAAQSEDGKSSAFGTFSGFGKTPPSASNTFGFLTNIANKTEEPKTNGTAQKEKESSENSLDEYYAKLKGLNESVTEWIEKHVRENPFVNLQPIFKDYDKYYNDLEKSKKVTTKAEETVNTSTSYSFGTTVSTTSPKFSFGTTSGSSSGSFSFGNVTTASLSFGTNTTKSFTSSAPSFSFGSSKSSQESGTFSFTSTVVKPADTKDPEEEEEPPKEEITPVVEEGHIYTTRCKVFVKKEGNFGDHGIGTLYLKPVPDSEKVQLIVRAETNLGRLICNFILSESIPMQRMGKKDVMLVCVPNQDMQPPPVPILLRVKSPEDADELLKTLQKHKK